MKVYYVVLGESDASWSVFRQDPGTGDIFRTNGNLNRNPGEWQLEVALHVIATQGDRVLSVLPQGSFREGDLWYRKYWVVTEPIAAEASS